MDIKIYIRSEKKVYTYTEEGLYFHEDQELSEILENFREENEAGKEITVSLILHFSYFSFYSEIKEKTSFIKRYVEFFRERYYLNYTENRYMDIYFKRDKIRKLKKIFKSMKFKIVSLKLDFDILYNNYKEENVEIVHIGEEESLRILIEEEKIAEMEKLDLKLSDISDIDDFDFGNMKAVALREEDVKSIFEGDGFSEGRDFLKKEEKVSLSELKKIKLSEIAAVVLITGGYFFLTGRIPLEKVKTENENIKLDTKKMEEEYLKKKNEKLPDYSEELSRLNEIDNGIKRREYYSVIKFLVDNSNFGIDYTKVAYEDKKWTIQGEIKDFNNFEKFEGNIQKKYSETELGYIKDTDMATIFEYSIMGK